MTTTTILIITLTVMGLFALCWIYGPRFSEWNRTRGKRYAFFDEKGGALITINKRGEEFVRLGFASEEDARKWVIEAYYPGSNVRFVPSIVFKIDNEFRFAHEAWKKRNA